ncbi:MAG TPA: hypothetical protein VLT47_10990 [Anaeromyxobacteraceae bacterium]|nr:hypothetical protein [Anaeromyxobacteraceae bacterium]
MTPAARLIGAALRHPWHALGQLFYSLPWRYLFGRRQGFTRRQSIRLAWAFTTLTLRLSPATLTKLRERGPHVAG